MSRDDPESYQFLVMIRRTNTGYSVDVPDLPGCVSAGRPVNTARKMIAEAIPLPWELMGQPGEPIPVPRRSIEFTIDEDAGEELVSWVEVVLPAQAEIPQGS